MSKGPPQQTILVEDPSDPRSATIFKLTNSRPIATRMVNASGDGVTPTTPADTQPVSGTVTANQGTAHATESWRANLTSALPAGTNNIGDVDLASALPAGTNNIGDVDVLTLPSIPAGTNNIGDVDVVSEVAAAFDHGHKSAIGTTAVQITTTSIVAAFGVLVKAANANGGRVFVGNSDVTADTADATSGFELGAGESVVVRVDNANKVWVIGSAANQKIFFLVV